MISVEVISSTEVALRRVLVLVGQRKRRVVVFDSLVEGYNRD